MTDYDLQHGRDPSTIMALSNRVTGRNTSASKLVETVATRGLRDLKCPARADSAVGKVAICQCKFSLNALTQ